MSDVCIVGVGMTPFRKHPTETVKSLTAAAVSGALDDAGLSMSQVQAAWFSNTRQGVFEGQHGIRGQVALRACGFESIPIFNTDSACASSSSALYQAFTAVKAGLHDIVLVVGAEKMVFPERRAEMFAAFQGSWDVELADSHMAALLALGDKIPAPDGEEVGERSVFMDIYAAMARFHMATFGTTQREIAAVAAKNHSHSRFNPNAQYQVPYSIEEVLGDKSIAWPLTRSMCAPMSDGAAAAVLVSSRVMESLALSRRAVHVRGIGASTGSPRQPEDVEAHLTRRAADRAYEMAGAGPEDIDVAELHDATAFAEILQSENCGFAAYGEGGRLAVTGQTALGGRLPVNVSGGLLSKGHPVAATGLGQIHELVTQLRGEAGNRQVDHARMALAENGGGFHGIEEAACVVTVLEAVSPRRPPVLPSSAGEVVST
ncbi:thiolase family protein [Pseudonocardia oroxyli]|uniref:propanoyl-CoA C-acyltransferase n=1 Tax=Pseudonocardia oroxyli TaxID=366584 RepID=A0A1G8D7M3_PSEOR|nr:thiolase family protein [Pseudonocardia oroxyli]SDH53742.1 Acetyl-CoA acetyltransferase [Pseudonocardia oroxyli]